jgi:Predicted permeases
MQTAMTRYAVYFTPVKILHRYVLREHLGPLVFALTALTSILLLQYVGKNIGNLVGKGLSPMVMVEFFALSVPLTVALTLPMAVLVSTLYAFSRLAAENEITALQASGVTVMSILRPVLWAAALLTLLMVGFNDQVLPRANHRLAILQRDIAQKKPTFGLREQVINEVSPGKFYLRAGHLDEKSNRMREVTIYDMGDPSRKRTIFADSGNMAMNPNMADLELTLYDGNMQDLPSTNPTQLQRLYFTIDFIKMRGVGNQFEKTGADTYKGNREMTMCELFYAEKRAQIELRNARQDFLAQERQAIKNHLKISQGARETPLNPPASVDLSRLYCQLIHFVSVKTAGAQAVQASSTPAVGAHASSTLAYFAKRPPVAASSTPFIGTTRQPVASSTPATASSTAPVLAAEPTASPEVDAAAIRLSQAVEMMDDLSVEVNKKFALAAACFVFVMLGAPIALRFPRGGVGLTIGVSLVVFGLYYVALIGGEALGKRGIIPPAISMWLADVVFAIVAIILLSRMGTEGTTSRGGDTRELLDTMKGWFRVRFGGDRRQAAR